MRAGVGTPATPKPSPPPLAGRTTFNESRGRNPGNTSLYDYLACTVLLSFNESRGRNPGNTRHRHGALLVQVLRSMRAGVGTPATPMAVSAWWRFASSFNESRGRNPGNTGTADGRDDPQVARSMRAGVGTPATLHRQHMLVYMALRVLGRGEGFEQCPVGFAGI